MKHLTGKSVVIYSLILGSFVPWFMVSAYPKLITPDTLKIGYATQVASTTAQIKVLQEKLSHCPTTNMVGSQCASYEPQIKSLKNDLHILDVSYQLMNSSLQASVAVYQ